ncbi:MAG: DNA ligase, partial [Jiangellaceae bacterium]
LLLGVPSDGGLTYVGHVGTGFTQAMLDNLKSRLARLERKSSPFAQPLARADARDAHWVTPKLVGEVVFGEWTRDGRLRQPSWRGLRPDKSPTEVVRET